MSKKQQQSSDGCATLMRRTFLFLMGIAIAKFLNNYFSVAKNREEFWQLVTQLKEQIIAFLSKEETPITATNTPLPTNLPSNPPVSSAPTPTPTETSTPTPTPTETPTPKPTPTPQASLKGKPIEFSQKTLNGVPFYQVTIDLNDPETFINIGLVKGATQANSAQFSLGDEKFEEMVNRGKGAIAANGTFFSKDEEKRILGNLVAEGRFLKYSRWENYGTTLGIKADNKLEMITARVEGQPQWQNHWFSLSCGPRLVKEGKVWLNPKTEGFSDPHIFDAGWRTAIGFPQEGNKLYLINFGAILSLEQEADLMKAIGCYEAMNLDGGASRALAHRGQIIVPAGRPLTNVILVYDTVNPAPESVKQSWVRFQNGERPVIPT